MRGRIVVSPVALVLALGAALLAAGARASGPAAPASGTRVDAAALRDWNEPGVTVFAPNADPAYHLAVVAEANARRDRSDGRGRARIEGVGRGRLRLQAGGTARITLVYTAGAAGVAAGGSVGFRLAPGVGWGIPQITSPLGAGYVTAAASTPEVRLELRATPTATRVDAVVRGRALRAGEEVRFVYGAGAALTPVQTVAERDERLWVLVDGNGDGVAAALRDSPRIDVVPGPAARLVAFWPSTARPGERVTLRVALLDEHGNRVDRPRRSVDLGALPPGFEQPRATRIGLDADGSGSLELLPREPGVHRVTVRTRGELVAITNPLVVEDGATPLLWGDLHGHSQLSDGTGPPEAWFAYARDVAALDVAALTDHDHHGAPFRLDEEPESWRRIRAAVERFDAPGRFVTLLGFEWTSWLHGHRHVLYFEDDGPVLSSIRPETGTPTRLWNALRGRAALTFAHHSAGLPVATNWAYAPDPELEPLTEIVSVHGSSESASTVRPVRGLVEGATVRAALDRGLPLGFVGSGDSHDGHPGCVAVPDDSSCGLVAVLGASRNRASVLAALRERRTYATNGPRIRVDARLDGRPVGASVPAAGPHRLTLAVAAEAPLRVVHVIRGRGPALTIDPRSQRELRAELDLAPLEPGEYVYLRIEQIDAGAAWTSPFFVAR